MSLQKMGFGVLNKLALYFEKPFWSPTEDYFGITSRDPERRGENFLFWNMQRYAQSPSHPSTDHTQRHGHAGAAGAHRRQGGEADRRRD